MWLRLYRARRRRSTPIAEIELDAAAHRTFGFWHVFVAGARAGWLYTWRADGPERARGRAAVRRAPRAARPVGAARQRRGLGPRGRDRRRLGLRAARRDRARPTTTTGRAIGRSRRPLHDAVIYELHVGGFTRHPSAGVAEPGTFRGLVEKIPYLQSLGITDVELLPVFAFDTQDVPAATAALGLHNFWGYSPVSFFAPHRAYAHGGDPRREFRDMVKALHAAGIGVILDVVLNHTAEGGADGPTIGCKGLVNELFYLLDARGSREVSRLHGLRQHGELESAARRAMARSSACASGPSRCTSTAFVSISRACCRATRQGEPLAHAPVIAAHRVRSGARRRRI